MGVAESQFNRAQLIAFVKQLPVAVAMFDRDMRYLYASDRWCSDYALDTKHVQGLSHYEVFPDVPERWKDVHRRALAGESLGEEIDCFERADGTRNWLRWEARPWGDINGMPEGIFIFAEDVTKRKLAEDALLQRETQLQAAFSAMTDAVSITDEKGHLVYSNEAYSEFHRFPSAEQCARTVAAMPAFIEAFFLDGRQAPFEQWPSNRALRGETGANVEYRLRRKDTDETWIGSFNFAPIRTDDGTITGSIVVRRDISEQKRVDAALRESEQRYRALVEQASDLILVHDAEGRIVDVNHEAHRSLGYSREEMLELTIFDISATATPEKARRNWAKASKSVLTLQSRLRRRDKYEFPVEIRLSTIVLNGKRLYLALVRDISERLQVQETMARLNQQYRDLVDNSPDWIARVDLNGRYLFANARASEMAHRSTEFFIGREVGTIFNFDGDPWIRAIRKVAESGNSVSVETRLLLHGGREAIMDIRFVPEFSEDKRVRSVLMIATDVTSQRQGEQELRRLSIALLTAEEEAAKQIARELHDDISQRLAFVAVELGKRASELGQSENLGIQMRSYQARLLQISDGVRNISHQMHPAILDDLGLSAALESLCLDMQHTSGIAVVFVASNVPDDLDHAIASCLYRVCQESLRNIQKHAKATGVSVRLSAQNEHLELVLEDNGTGFDTKLVRGGLGVRSIRERVALVGGAINIHSAPGSGTRIVATVPLKTT